MGYLKPKEHRSKYSSCCDFGCVCNDGAAYQRVSHSFCEVLTPDPSAGPVRVHSSLTKSYLKIFMKKKIARVWEFAATWHSVHAQTLYNLQTVLKAYWLFKNMSNFS